MGRLECIRRSLGRALHALQFLVLLLVLLFVALPHDNAWSILFAVLIVLLLLATAVGLWRRPADGDGQAHLGTADDITSDPFADPGQAAKDRWEQAVRRLPGEDDERD
ncbi:hypothetical protein [Halopiger xanaduensis]|uniref:Uncharacterized protein n=1 Tax=Halopiger xanaduensis (strain DSM 18323 / JCM 14033 / SH-6) TaxID=797210 RepID=F8D3Z5_HALXS|nr:hypothetical protein [Halopiger xanaduensis]AEH36248.1 hypothetical protein Halxa_1616 [Halopiger xanaduensis SH-6]